LKTPFHPLTTCGIGQNLYVRPDGRIYPCYAWCNEHTYIGNIFEKGLKAVLDSPSFTRLIDCTVDTIEKCRDCDYRYLCGGACRAWGNQQTLDLNAAPVQCRHLQERAEKLIETAKAFL
ncbi:MAG: SPASM domain-containing protein, partial [Tannerella sp.]|nr:SPASM domain-containing protein [Tannerella sp.]